jgi:hypothetical protein
MASAVKANSRLAALEMDSDALYLFRLATISLAYILLKKTSREKCNFLNVSCYTPECGGPGHFDPRL